MRIAAFIDGSNIYATSKALNFHIDYALLRKFLEEDDDLIRAFYYTAIHEDATTGDQRMRGLVDYLDYNGYTVKTKIAKEFLDRATGVRKIKGNMDIEIAVDALEIIPYIDEMILFSGDGDFRSLVEAVQRKGVRVTVISSLESHPPMIADELRRQCDQFIDLSDIRAKIERKMVA